jgi:hypothetical protein
MHWINYSFTSQNHIYWSGYSFARQSHISYVSGYAEVGLNPQEIADGLYEVGGLAA